MKKRKEKKRKEGTPNNLLIKCLLDIKKEEKKNFNQLV